MNWTREALLDAYQRMRTIRVFEDKLAELVMSGTLAGFLHLYAGGTEPHRGLAWKSV